MTTSRTQDAAARARGLAAIADAPRPAPQQRPSKAQQPTLQGTIRLPGARRQHPPPELGAVVELDCSPPLRGTVEGVDLNRKWAYVRTRYGVLPFGFAEIKR